MYRRDEGIIDANRYLATKRVEKRMRRNSFIGFISFLILLSIMLMGVMI